MFFCFNFHLSVFLFLLLHSASSLPLILQSEMICILSPQWIALDTLSLTCYQWVNITNQPQTLQCNRWLERLLEEERSTCGLRLLLHFLLFTPRSTTFFLSANIFKPNQDQQQTQICINSHFSPNKPFRSVLWGPLPSKLDEPTDTRLPVPSPKVGF